MAKGIIGCHVELRRGDVDTATNFTAVGYIFNVSGPTQEANQLDVSTLDDESCDKVFEPGIKTPGEVTFSIIFDPNAKATHGWVSGIIYDINNDVKRYWQEYLPYTSPVMVTYQAFVKRISGPVVTKEEKVKMDVTLQTSGPVVYSN